MADRREELELGVSVIPSWESVEQTRELVRAADEGGLGLVGIQDHPYQSHFLDTFSLVAVLLAEPERFSFFPDVATLPLRPPAMMAQAAASLDVLSGGRFELGLGAGAFWEAVGAMGGPTRSPGEAVDALAEAIDVIRLMWSTESSVRFDGRHYPLSGVKPGPQR